MFATTEPFTLARLGRRLTAPELIPKGVPIRHMEILNRTPRADIFFSASRASIDAGEGGAVSPKILGPQSPFFAFLISIVTSAIFLLASYSIIATRTLALPLKTPPATPTRPQTQASNFMDPDPDRFSAPLGRDVGPSGRSSTCRGLASCLEAELRPAHASSSAPLCLLTTSFGLFVFCC